MKRTKPAPADANKESALPDEHASSVNRELQARLRFEALLAEIAARFVNLPSDQVEHEINEAQRRLCENLGFDRSSLFQLTGSVRDGPFLLQHLHQPVEAPFVPPEVDAGRTFPWVMSQLQRGETVLISSIADLPAEAACDLEGFRRYGTKSVAVFPLQTGGVVVAVLTFATLHDKREWPEALVTRLQLVAQVFANALAREWADRELRETEARLSLAAESAGTGLWVMEVETRRFWGTPRTRMLFGFSPEEELTYDKLAAKVLPEDQEQLRQAVDQALQTRGELKVDSRIALHDGTVRWIVIRGRSHGTALGRPDRIMGVCNDITERVQTEEALRLALEEVQRLRDQLQQENVYLRKEVQSLYGHTRIIGKSQALQHALSQASLVAVTDSTVLLVGETGTGKELIASAIHELSSRRDRAMVRVNCSAIPAALVESELFGREKGAYTGAFAKQMGSFEYANGSSIFLDEVSELPLDTQAKLLRVLQERKIQRLGSPKPVDVDVRVIAASNRDMEKLVRDGKFREDLYYRLNVFPIRVPPLRERPEDIPLLVWAFVSEFAQTMGKQIESIARSVIGTLQHYPWPGNVRELRNVIERSMILASGPKLDIALPLPHGQPQTPDHGIEAEDSPPRSLDDVQRRHILNALERTGWRIQGRGGAAEILGMKRTTLQSRMAKLGIRRPGGS